jgi:hypothetical protein
VIGAAVTGDDKQIRDRLEVDERFARVPPALFGKPSNAHCWALAADVPNLLNGTPTTTPVEKPTDVAPGLAAGD